MKAYGAEYSKGYGDIGILSRKYCVSLAKSQTRKQDAMCKKSARRIAKNEIRKMLDE